MTGPVEEHTVEIESVSPEVTDGGTAEPPPVRILRRGTSVGRFVITDTLGKGGMGVVYSAYDPELDRKVALKLLRTDRTGFKDPKEAQVRLLREARALARLSHPNVISIYDVQTFEDQVVLAMEFVDGKTLGAWLDETERSWREVLAVFVGAGKGLAAAHAAEVVHRDFKPSNVLVTSDGRAKVLDFGLARPTTGGLSSVSVAIFDLPTVDLPQLSSGNLSTTCVTLTGDVVGTPLYMSPEQHIGRGIDARSDQFSFCVALYIALYGQRPFAGRTRKDLARATIRGDVRDPPRGTAVPGRIKLALRKGLSRHANNRFDSMDELLAELARDPDRRNRMIGFGVVGGAALIGVGAVLPGLYTPTDTCPDGEQALGGAWSSERKDAVEAAFAGSSKPFAAAVLDRVRPALDEYAAAWGRAHEDACEATRVRHEQSDRLLDLKMACLDQQRREFDALTEVLASGDDDVLRNAITAAQRLDPVRHCANLDGTEEPLFADADPLRQEAIDELRSRVAKVSAFANAGKYKEGLPHAQRLVGEAEALEHKALTAEANYYLGLIQARSGDTEAGAASMASAEFAARASRHDRLSARVLTELTYHVGQTMKRFEEARRWGEHAEAAIERVGGDPLLRAQLLSARGNVREGLGEYEDAKRLYDRSLALYTEVAGPESAGVARALNNLGNVAFRQGERTAAKAAFTKAYENWRAALGDEHPDAAMPLVNLATVELTLGNRDLAQQRYEEVLGLWERNLGPGHHKLAIPLNNLATLLREKGDNETALEYDRRALAIRSKALGPAHPEVAISHFGIGMSQANLGNYAEAAAAYKRALEIREEKLGSDHPSVGETYGNLSLVQVHLEPRERAIEYARKGLDIRLRAFGPDHVAVAYPWYQIAVVHMELDRPADAIGPLERVLELRSNGEITADDRAAPRFELAQAYLRAGRGKDKARAAAELARKEYLEAQMPEEAATVERFLDGL